MIGFERRPSTQEKNIDDIKTMTDNINIFLNDALKSIWEKLLEIEKKVEGKTDDKQKK